MFIVKNAAAARLGRRLSARVLWKDKHYIALDKPPGVTVQGGTKKRPALSDRECLGALAAELSLPSSNASEQLRICHRLDRPTTGVLLLARSVAAARKIQPLFASPASALQKTYLAVCEAADDTRTPPRPGEEGVVDLWLVQREGVSIAVPYEIAQLTPDAQRACTRYQVLHQSGKHCLVQFTPVTGRRHQIRSHSAHGLGLHILHDPKYIPAHGINQSRSSKKNSSSSAARLHLHAASLRFLHPFEKGAVVEIHSPLPADTKDLCRSLNLAHDRPAVY
jgi:23S rRNA-/tRNA-specific pseudouridylate synthase